MNPCFPGYAPGPAEETRQECSFSTPHARTNLMQNLLHLVVTINQLQQILFSQGPPLLVDCL